MLRLRSSRLLTILSLVNFHKRKIEKLQQKSSANISKQTNVDVVKKKSFTFCPLKFFPKSFRLIRY